MIEFLYFLDQMSRTQILFSDQWYLRSFFYIKWVFFYRSLYNTTDRCDRKFWIPQIFNISDFCERFFSRTTENLDKVLFFTYWDRSVHPKNVFWNGSFFCIQDFDERIFSLPEIPETELFQYFWGRSFILNKLAFCISQYHSFLRQNLFFSIRQFLSTGLFQQHGILRLITFKYSDFLRQIFFQYVSFYT